MAVALLLLVLALMCLFFFLHGACIRGSVLLAATSWGVLVTLFTESLSALRILNFQAVTACWGLTAALCLCLVMRGGNPAKIRLISGLREHGAVPGAVAVQLLLIAVLAMLTGIVAVVAAPNTGDSMVFHMSRVAHWIQNRTVAHYPTHILKQIYMAPWAEFPIAHLQVLSAGDRWANMVEYAAMLGGLIGVSLVAKELGGGIFDQVFSVSFVASIPSGILQASSSQTDWVAAFWLVSFVYFGLRASSTLEEKTHIHLCFASGAALGLSVLSKSYSYMYALPFVVWFLFEAARNRGRNVWKTVGIVLVVSLALNAGHYLRNFNMFGSPFAPRDELASVTNQVVSFKAAASNVLRNVAVNLGTPFDTINRGIDQGVFRIHSALGIDVNDPRTTYLTNKFGAGYSFEENAAPNPLHFVFVIVTGVAFVLLHKRNTVRVSRYACCTLAGFLLLCVMLKWARCYPRYHLTFLTLAAPLVAMQLGRMVGSRMTAACSVVLLVCGMPMVFWGEPRPLAGPTSVLLSSRDSRYLSWNHFYCERCINEMVYTVQQLRPKRIGLITNWFCFEYPLWVFLKANDNDFPTIEHVSVKNVSGRKGYSAPGIAGKPDCIITMCLGSDETLLTEYGRYRRIFLYRGSGAGRCSVCS